MESGDQNITQAFYSPALHNVVVVTFDHNISLLSIDNLSLNRHVSTQLHACNSESLFSRDLDNKITSVFSCSVFLIILCLIFT